MGGGILDLTVNLEADGGDVITSDHVADNIRCIASDLLASGSSLNDGAEYSDGDGNVVGVDVDTVPLTEPYYSNAQLTSDASTEKNAKIPQSLKSLVDCTDNSDIASLDLNISSSLYSEDTG